MGFIGTSTTNSYTDVGAVAGGSPRFYTVKAVK
jgi:hypothetical protein